MDEINIQVDQKIIHPSRETQNPNVLTFEKPEPENVLHFRTNEIEIEEEDDGNIQDIAFNKNIFDICSKLNVLCVYNDEEENVEVYDLEQVLQSWRGITDQSYSEIRCKYPIQRESLRNVTIISNVSYPLISLSTADGIILISINNCQEFQRINISEQGNDTIKYHESRMNQIVCLSHNHTLFTYNFTTKQHQLLSSEVTDYTITSSGSIFFCCQNKFYTCEDPTDIRFKFQLFDDTLRIRNVLNSHIFIISTREITDQTDVLNPYIYSLYNYQDDKIVCKYDSTQSDRYDLAHLRVTSSPNNSLIIVSNIDTVRYFILNLKYEFVKLVFSNEDDEMQLPNKEGECDDEYDDLYERIRGLFFLEHTVNDLEPYPSLIGFFGHNFIRSYTLRNRDEQEVFIQHPPTEESISFNDIREPQHTVEIREFKPSPQNIAFFQKTGFFRQLTNTNEYSEKPIFSRFQFPSFSFK